MKLSGDVVLRAPVEQVWDALLDPAVLVRTIPGCERLETTGDNAYAMTVTAGVASIKGTYSGTCELRDLQPHESLVMKAKGEGGPGTIAADVLVRFTDGGDHTTSLSYDADAVVGGMIGGVGQRLLSSVSKRMAGEFFGNVEQVLNGTAPVVSDAPTAAAPAESKAPRVFERPVSPATRTDPQEFLKGVLVGATVVLAGVVAGALAARRR